MKMEKKRLTKEEVINDIKGLFEIAPLNETTTVGKSFIEVKENKTSFYFSENRYTRYDAIKKLSRYLDDKVIIDGRCVIENIALFYTIVSIEDNN